MINNTLRFTVGCFVAAGSLVVAYKAGTDLYEKYQDNKKTQNYKAAVAAHNKHYEVMYRMPLGAYMDRLVVPFRYVHRFRYVDSTTVDQYEILMCPFGMLINNDVALLLAAAMAERQYGKEFTTVLGGGKLVWSNKQTRYVTRSDLAGGYRDIHAAEYTVEQYLAQCLYLRSKIKSHREENVINYINKQVKILKQLLDDSSFEPGESMC